MSPTTECSGTTREGLPPERLPNIPATISEPLHEMMLAVFRQVAAKKKAGVPLRFDNLARNLAVGRERQPSRRLVTQRPAATPRPRERRARRTTRSSSRAGPDDSDEPARAYRPPLTAEHRRELKAAVDRARRIQVRQRAIRDLQLFDGDVGRVR